MKINPRINRLIKIVAAACKELSINAYLVGGPVRDLFLGESNIDLDIAVDKDIEKLLHSLSETLGAEFVYHRQFKTATVFLDNLNIDIATTREEIYPSGGSLPEVSASSLDKDLFRRDFTINAMAVQIKETGPGSLIDPYNGLEDLRNKKIRILHNRSFQDDPTRIIRAIRFETRLDFSLEKKTLALLKEAVSRNAFSRVSSSRIGNEIVKLLQENQPLKGIKRLNQLCGLRFIHPQIKFNKQWNLLFPQAGRHMLKFAKISRRDIEPWIVYFILLTETLDKSALAELCESYELKRRQRIPIMHAHYLRNNVDIRNIGKDSPSSIYAKLKPLYPEAVIYLASKTADARIKEKLFRLLAILDNIRVCVGGEELKKMGFRPGPVFNKILEALFLAKLDGIISTRKEELRFIENNFGQKL